MLSEPATEQLPSGTPVTVAGIEPSPPTRMTPPEFIVPLKPVEAKDGQELQMTCKVTGQPAPNLMWFHDSKNIDDDEEFVISYNPDTGDIKLIIVEVFPEDQGQYICIAQNPAGQATTSGFLTVIETEELEMEVFEEQQEQPTEAQVTEAEFVIQAPEEPMEVTEVSEEMVQPQIIDRPKVEPLVKEEVMVESPIPESLPEEGSEIYETALESLEEVYEEVTEPNIVSKAIPRPKVVPLEPEPVPVSPEPEFEMPIEEEPQPDLGEPVMEESVTSEFIKREVKIVETLTTAAQQETVEIPTTEVEIPTTEVEIPTTEKETIEFMLPGKEPDEEETTMQEQEITFVIKATGIEETEETEVKEPVEEQMPKEQAIEAQFVLPEDAPQQILQAELPGEVPPEFVEMLQPQVVEDGTNVILGCRLVGSPPPSVTWYKSSIVIEPNPDFRQSFDSETGICVLEIKEVFPEDTGVYMCRAVNPFGEANTTCNIIVKGKIKYQYLHF